MSSDWWSRVSFRTSSRGRMVVPPLRFWKGERIGDIYRCFTTDKDGSCNCLELDGTKMLSKFLEKGPIKNNCEMKNKTLIVSVADSLHSQRRNGQHWMMPEKSVQKVLKVEVGECDLLKSLYKRELDSHGADRTPSRKRRRTVGAEPSPQPVEGSDRRSRVRNANKKDDGIARSIHRDLSTSFKSVKHSCENSDSLNFGRNLQCCVSCEDARKDRRRTFIENKLDANLRTKFLKRYPDMRDVRVNLVDLRHWTCGKVLSLRALCEIPELTVRKRPGDLQGRVVTSSGYWLRQMKLVIPSTLCPTRQGHRKRKEGKLGSRCLHASLDTGARRTSVEGRCFDIRDSRVVLSPLSTSQLKMFQRGKLRPKSLKSFSQKQKETDRYCSKDKYKQGSAGAPSTVRRKSSKSAGCGKAESNRKTTASGMITPTKKRPLSVYSPSQKRKKRSSWKKNEISKISKRGSADMFEDPLYAGLLSSSDTDYSVNFDDSHAGYEKQSTPLSKYLDVRDESTDRVSAKSTPTRFHSKMELKQHVSKVRRMRAKKLRRRDQQKTKEPEKLELGSNNDGVEKLSDFEQLKRALGLMDKVQKKICEDRYSEEELYFADSDN